MKPTGRLAFGALLCALTCVTLLMSFFPYASISIAALAGVWLIPAVLELGLGYAVICYVVTAVLSFALTPDLAVKLLYAVFFGYYPIVQIRLNLWSKRVWCVVVKLIMFNVVIILSFILLTNVFHVNSEVFLINGQYLPAVLLMLGNIVFCLYDIGLTRIGVLYRVRFHPLVRRVFK